MKCIHAIISDFSFIILDVYLEMLDPIPILDIFQIQMPCIYQKKQSTRLILQEVCLLWLESVQAYVF